MTRKRRKKRRGLWAWLMGRERPEPSAGGPPPGAGERAEATPAEHAGPPAEPPTAAGSCPICGGTEFRWGWLETGLYGAGKGPPGPKQPRYAKPKTRFGDFIGLRGRMCVACGHVEVFASAEPPP